MPALSKVRVRPSGARMVLAGIVAFLFLMTLVVVSATASGWALAFAAVLGAFCVSTLAGGRWRDGGELALEAGGVVVVRAPGLKKAFTRDHVEDGYGVRAGGLVVHFKDGTTLEAMLAEGRPRPTCSVT